MGLLFAVVGVAFVVALISAFFSIAQWIALLRFSRWAFGMGPRVLVDAAEYPLLPRSEDVSLDTERGEFRRIAEDTVLFRPRSRGLSILDAFAVAGTLRWGKEETTIEGRLPLSTILFVGSFLAGWSAITAIVWIAGGNRFVVLGLVSVVPLVVLAAGYLLVPMEVRRARGVLDELRTLLGGRSPKQVSRRQSTG